MYKSQYRAIYTYKMSAQVRPRPRDARAAARARDMARASHAVHAARRGSQELDSAFRDVLGSDWTIKNDERVKYVGKLEVETENQTLKVRTRARDAWCPSRAAALIRRPLPSRARTALR